MSTFTITTSGPGGSYTLTYLISGSNVGVNSVVFSGFTSVIIPQSVTNLGTTYNVTSINTNAFLNSVLTSVSVPLTITTLGDSVFEGCSALTSATFALPSSLTTLGIKVFRTCTALTSITLPSSLTTLNSEAFYACTALTNVTLPSSLTSIDNIAFQACTALTTISLPSTLTTLNQGVFFGCSSLTSISLPSSLTNLGFEVFKGCSALTNAYMLCPYTSFFDTTAFNNINANSSLYYNSSSPQFSNYFGSSFLNYIPYTLIPTSSVAYSKNYTNLTTITMTFPLVITNPAGSITYTINNPNGSQYAQFSGSNRTSYTFTNLLSNNVYSFSMVVSLNPTIQTIPLVFSTSITLLNSTNPSPLILFYPGTITLNYYGNIADQYQLINNLGQVVSSTFSFNSTNQTITFNVIIQYGGNNILSFYDTTLNKLIGTFSIETSGICFKEGTKILCHLDKREKYVPIEEIQEDMLVKVYTGKHKKPEYKRASAIVKSQLINTPVTTINKLYRLSKSVCPQLIEDLYVTGSHALLHDQLTEEQHEKMTHLADFYNTYTIRLENEEAMSEEQRETLKSMMHSYNDYQITHLDKFKLIAYYNEDFEEVNIEKVFNIYHIVLENVNKYDSYGIYANGILAESTSEASLERFPHYERINILAKKVREDIPYIEKRMQKYFQEKTSKKIMDTMFAIEDQTIQQIENKVNHTSKRRKTIYKNRTYKKLSSSIIHIK